MKQSYAIPNALAITTAIVFVLCATLVGLFPDILFSIAQSWFHGIEFSKAVLNITISSFILGLISSTITAWIIGYIFITCLKVTRSKI